MSTRVFNLREIDEAASLLRSGGLVAFPTETVYGLGASIAHPDSIARIFQVKKRPSDNPLIVHIAFVEQLNELSREIPESAYVLAEAFFPGPLTLILKKASSVPLIATGGKETIALRMPAHTVAKSLIERTGPLVAPSANLSGKPSSTCVEHVLNDFEGVIEGAIDGGQTKIGIESTVISLLDPEKPTVLRPGEISKEQIAKVLGCEIYTSHDSKLSPGTRYRHYAPEAAVHLFDTQEALENHLSKFPEMRRKVVIPKAQTLYASLRLADALGLDEICFLCDSEALNNAALMNRLHHASKKI